MTFARQIVPGSIYLLTRRCSEQRHFLAPQGGSTALFGYLFALSAARHGIEVLGCVQMSNHYHAVVHDPHGELPAFTHHFHGLLARAGNRLRGRVESFWDPRPPHYVELTDGEAVISALVYVASNPVAAGAVREGKLWPGFRISPAACTRNPVEFKRPNAFFVGHGPTPPVARLAVRVPPTHRALTPQAFAELLARRVKLREKELQDEVFRAGKSFAGPKKAAALNWNAAARRTQPKPTTARPLSPRKRGVLTRLTIFRRMYRAALEQLRVGVLDVVFPAGTWRLSRLLGVATTASPPPAWSCCHP